MQRIRQRARESRVEDAIALQVHAGVADRWRLVDVDTAEAQVEQDIETCDGKPVIGGEQRPSFRGRAMARAGARVLTAPAFTGPRWRKRMPQSQCSFRLRRRAR